MKLRLSDLVRTPEGAVTTLAALLDSGEAKVSRVDNWQRRGGNIGTIYLVELLNGGGAWEIGKTAYESRSGQTPQVKRLNE
jgi:hypothetical protein